MALSNDLISQFVKITNDKSETKKDTTVYGTTVEQNGTMYVQLDGSDLLTPVSTTANTKSGERVMVLIKNHTATITGNVSSPSARIGDLENLEDAADKITEFEIILADKVDTADLNAANARIDVLVSDNVLIKNQLTADSADIDNLQANILEVHDRFTANEAVISDLEATKLDADIADLTYATIKDLEVTNETVYNLKATYGDFADLTTEHFSAIDAVIDDLDVTYATITDLDVERARIDILEASSLYADSAIIKQLQADIADIDTLIFGSASGTVIQTSFANAVIAQLGNAQIKSAMIESVSADKITAGDIITNNVRVMSEDGKLLISDETIQISDETRVRVQIGKDAAGDYSINIWDTDGNLMFSEGGITDNAIKEAIIRDDMVSDTANISAHKLNIESLFEEINGSVHTIQSSKIMMDAEGQTLDVVFTDMSTELTELEELVNTQGTSLSVIQGQISSKIWKQDIATAIDDVNADIDTLNTSYSSVIQEIDSVSATVASHTAQISDKADNSAVIVVNEKVSDLELSLDGFRTSVSETYATKDDVDNIQIGGRNLLLGTNQGTSKWSYIAANGSYSKEEHVDTDGVRAAKLTCSVASTSWCYAQYVLEDALTKLLPNTEYTISFDLLTDISEPIKICILRGDGTQPLSTYTSEITTIADETWHRYIATITTNDLSIGLNNQVLYISGVNHVGYRIFKNLKLEIGNKATDWTPAPEDLVMDEDLADVEERVSKNESNISQNADNISAVVARTTAVESDVANTESDIASLKLTADGLTTRVTNVEVDAENALTNAAKAQSDVDNLEIGGRNYIRNGKGDVKDGFFAYFNTVDEGYGEHTITSQKTYAYVSLASGFIIGCREYEVGAQVVLSYDIMYTAWDFPEGTTRSEFWMGQRYTNQQSDSTDTTGLWRGVTQHNLPVVGVDCELNEWLHVEKVFTIPEPAAEGIGTAASIQLYNSNADVAASFTFRMKNVKLEYGNRATDWTPAPEDMATAKDNELAQSTADGAQETATRAETLVQQLSDNISMLVTDGNGTSLMTQTESGWTFSTAEIQSSIASAAEILDSLNSELGDTNNTVNVLQQAVDDLGEIAEYVKISTYEDEPCIELGESDSEFKLRITNTRILFLEGSSIIAHISNQSLHIKKAVIEEELQQGGFVWKVRSNGNMGLVWKGVTN